MLLGASTRLKPAIDALYRAGLRVAYPLLRQWWCLARPNHDGAVVAVWHGGKLLLLRHSYRRCLSWPGGGIRHGETPSAAARRELAEEIGIAIEPDALRLVGELVLYWEYRRDHVRIYETRLAAAPVLRLDNREVIDARFVAADEARRLPITPFVRAYLEGRLAPPRD